MYIERCRAFKKHFKDTVNVKFKKMTQRQRDYGRVIAIATMVLIILMGALSSCSPYMYRGKQVVVTHVLALTEAGDTIKIPINQIKPNVTYNVLGYDYYRPYTSWRPYYNDPYYHPNTYTPRYRPSNSNNSTSNYSLPSNSSFGGTGNVGNSGGNPNVSTPPPNPAATNPKKNN